MKSPHLSSDFTYREIIRPNSYLNPDPDLLGESMTGMTSDSQDKRE